MQFIVTAHDYEGGLEKRLAARDEHVALGDKMKEAGNYLMGVALVNEQGQMCGSVMILDYPSRKELDEWLEIEPYVINKVWEKWTVEECKVGPSFIS